MKKMVSLFMVLCLLALVLPGTAVKSEAIVPSVEDILNDYHAKAFEQKRTSAEGDVAAYARSGSGKTLEQETVETLRTAGYEAYNVTADNYGDIEDSLQTDLSAMGVDRDGSYIVVISGERENSSNPNSRAGGSFIEQDNGGLGGDGSFAYTYNGVTYTMRHAIVTSAELGRMYVDSTYILSEDNWVNKGIENIGESTLVSFMDSMVDKIPIGSIWSLLLDIFEDENYTEMEPGDLTIVANTTWVCHVIQVWCNDRQLWIASQSSEYARTMAHCVSYLHNEFTGEAKYCDGDAGTITRYSRLYSNLSQRKENAARAFAEDKCSKEEIPCVHFYLQVGDDGIIITDGGKALFSHYRTFEIPIYSE